MRETYDAETVNDFVAAWQDAFGPSFNKPAVEAAQKSLPAEQFIDTTLRIPIRLENRVTLIGGVCRAGVARAYDLPRCGDRVQKDRTIDFELRDLDVTGPYEVYWKVKNHGSEAVRAGQPRGDVIVGGATQYESTAFVGSHYVEVYIVQNNVCVAKDRQPVIIRRSPTPTVARPLEAMLPRFLSVQGAACLAFGRLTAHRGQWWCEQLQLLPQVACRYRKLLVPTPEARLKT